MEKTEELDRINQYFCNYYEQHSTAKKEDILCFKQDKKQLSEFYSSMNEQIYEQKMESIASTKRFFNR